MTKLQKKAVGLISGEISSVVSEIYSLDYRIKQLNDKICEIRCVNETNRTDPALTELHAMIGNLKGDLSVNPLTEAQSWLNDLEK